MFGSGSLFFFVSGNGYFFACGKRLHLGHCFCVQQTEWFLINTSLSLSYANTKGKLWKFTFVVSEVTSVAFVTPVTPRLCSILVSPGRPAGAEERTKSNPLLSCLCHVSSRLEARVLVNANRLKFGDPDGQVFESLFPVNLHRKQLIQTFTDSVCVRKWRAVELIDCSIVFTLRCHLKFWRFQRLIVGLRRTNGVETKINYMCAFSCEKSKLVLRLTSCLLSDISNTGIPNGCVQNYLHGWHWSSHTGKLWQFIIHFVLFYYFRTKIANIESHSINLYTLRNRLDQNTVVNKNMGPVMVGVEYWWELHGNLVMSSFSYVILMANIKYVIRVGKVELHLIIQLDEGDVV
jgi:hypothetical protein